MPDKIEIIDDVSKVYEIDYVVDDDDDDKGTITINDKIYQAEKSRDGNITFKKYTDDGVICTKILTIHDEKIGALPPPHNYSKIWQKIHIPIQKKKRGFIRLDEKYDDVMEKYIKTANIDMPLKRLTEYENYLLIIQKKNNDNMKKINKMIRYKEKLIEKSEQRVYEKQIISGNCTDRKMQKKI